MNESILPGDALAELLTLTVAVDSWGTTYYCNHLGKLHRIHGPAVISIEGYQYWYQNGLRHRTDGPALNWADGDCEWWLNGEYLTEEQFHERVKSV